VNEFALAVKLREKGRRKKALKLFLALLRNRPEDAILNYHCAWTYDNLGMERKAIPHYVRAIRNGLPARDLERALLGLGSTYRCIGEYRKAEATLRQGAAKFSKNHAMKIFLAMALFNTKKHQEAMKLLLRALAKTTPDKSIARYRRAIFFYSDKLLRRFC